jgi:hypothetical protein
VKCIAVPMSDSVSLLMNGTAIPWKDVSEEEEPKGMGHIQAVDDGK